MSTNIRHSNSNNVVDDDQWDMLLAAQLKDKGLVPQTVNNRQPSNHRNSASTPINSHRPPSTQSVSSNNKHTNNINNNNNNIIGMNGNITANNLNIGTNHAAPTPQEQQQQQALQLARFCKEQMIRAAVASMIQCQIPVGPALMDFQYKSDAELDQTLGQIQHILGSVAGGGNNSNNSNNNNNVFNSVFSSMMVVPPPPPVQSPHNHHIINSNNNGRNNNDGTPLSPGGGLQFNNINSYVNANNNANGGVIAGGNNMNGSSSTTIANRSVSTLDKEIYFDPSLVNGNNNAYHNGSTYNSEIRDRMQPRPHAPISHQRTPLTNGNNNNINNNQVSSGGVGGLSSSINGASPPLLRFTTPAIPNAGHPGGTNSKGTPRPGSTTNINIVVPSISGGGLSPQTFAPSSVTTGGFSRPQLSSREKQKQLRDALVSSTSTINNNNSAAGSGGNISKVSSGSAAAPPTHPLGGNHLPQSPKQQQQQRDGYQSYGNGERREYQPKEQSLFQQQQQLSHFPQQQQQHQPQQQQLPSQVATTTQYQYAQQHVDATSGNRRDSDNNHLNNINNNNNGETGGAAGEADVASDSSSQANAVKPKAHRAPNNPYNPQFFPHDLYNNVNILNARKHVARSASSAFSQHSTSTSSTLIHAKTSEDEVNASQNSHQSNGMALRSVSAPM